MANDKVADLLARLRNAYKAQHAAVTMPYSGLNENICKVLEAEGYIRGYRVEATDGKQDLVIELKYIDGEAAVKELKRVSKSGLRKYTKVAKMPKHYNGLGVSILSTSKGVMTDFQAREANVGGEVLCTVF